MFERETHSSICTVTNRRVIGSSWWNRVFALFTEGFGVIREIFPVFGVIIIVGAIIMYTQPRFANAWGIAILILGMISLIGIITTLGGILSMIGGYLATAWKPGEREVERHNYRFRYNG